MLKCGERSLSSYLDGVRLRWQPDVNPINRTMYKVIGRLKSSLQEEVIDEFETKKEAKSSLVEYRLAFGSNWKLYIV